MPTDEPIDAFQIINQVVLQQTMDELLNRAPRREDRARVIELQRRDRALWQAKQDRKEAKKDGDEA